MDIDDMDLPDYSNGTVEQIKDDLDSNDYSIPELRALREMEMESDDTRSTAIEAIDDELESVAGDKYNTDSYVETEELEEKDEDTLDYSQIREGEGCTEKGMPGVILPDPYSTDAPETLRIEIPVATGFAGQMFDDDGTYDIHYQTPNESDVAGMRVKRALEAGTNEVILSQEDPLHPSDRDEGE